jgi:hypothetical protein
MGATARRFLLLFFTDTFHQSFVGEYFNWFWLNAKHKLGARGFEKN